METSTVKRRYAIVRCSTVGAVSMVKVQTGCKVAAGETILGVEIMKMLHGITAPVSGEVELLVKVGEMVSEGQVVAKIYVTV